ncbi:MAG: UDP-N-acetylmuramoyl-L-alanyl-D-glutamate--2,6-diaminopimelate ligase [Opitutae bacterium]|nr:UDP-N-acetylmuramoyl-L-alanyl-D-glutamate--2,6-diaminopimelate ligase [Opitutae bacterium]
MNQEARDKPVRSVKLGRLLKGVPAPVPDGAAATEITSLACDSRAVRPGSLFFALPGEKTDGGLFIEDAARRGAAAVLHEKGMRPPRDRPSVCVECARTAMADVAAEFHGHPSKKLQVVGVTGTNGKTTTVFMVRDILRAAGIPCGIIGTIQYEFGERLISATRTTPESLDLQRIFSEALQAGDQAVAMEVSSQGLAAERLRGTRFAAAVFTNLTVDHLDFHKTMEAYFDAKKRLFEALAADSPGAPAAVNIDDPYGRRLAAEPFLAGHRLTFGCHPDAQVRAEDIHLSEKDSGFRAVTPWGEIRVDLGLAGRFNVSNALGAMSVCGALGVPLDAMASALSKMSSVPGRLERIADPRGTRHVFVDYAHSEDALRNVLQTLRETASGRLICVFGCGGNRDRSKRPRMGAAVSEFADFAIVSSDNPRNEDPLAILAEILPGMDRNKPHHVEPDRAKAIRAALQTSRAGDTVLVAGKGHETYQEIAGRMTHFDDREVIRAALAEGL